MSIRDELARVIARDSRYSIEAYAFVLESLRLARHHKLKSQAKKRERTGAPRPRKKKPAPGADQSKYDKLNAAIVGVSVDPVDSHVEFCTKENLTFKLLSDVDHKVVNMYGSTQKFGPNEVAARNTFVVDPKGTIRKVFLKVDPMPHSKEVLAAIEELQKSGKSE